MKHCVYSLNRFRFVSSHNALLPTTHYSLLSLPVSLPIILCSPAWQLTHNATGNRSGEELQFLSALSILSSFRRLDLDRRQNRRQHDTIEIVNGEVNLSQCLLMILTSLYDSAAGCKTTRYYDLVITGLSRHKDSCFA